MLLGCSKSEEFGLLRGLPGPTGWGVGSTSAHPAPPTRVPGYLHSQKNGPKLAGRCRHQGEA